MFRLTRKTTTLAVAATLSASLGVAALTNARPADAATTVPSYAMGIAGESWEIQNPHLCSPEISAGGNLVERGVRVATGKCQGAGESPQITGPRTRGR